MCITDKEVKQHIFFNLVQDGDKWSITSLLTLFIRKEAPYPVMWRLGVPQMLSRLGTKTAIGGYWTFVD